MNTRVTWSLVGTALVLLGVVLVLERRDRAGSGAAAPPLLTGFEPIRITRLEINRTNQLLRAERRGLGWQLTAPPYPAETVAVENFLQTIASLRRHASIPVREASRPPAGLAAFGLNPPRATVVLHAGTNRVTLHVGGQTLVGGQVYVQPAGTAEIFVTDGALASSLPLSTHDWREPLLVTLDNPTFDRLTVTNSGRLWFQLQHDLTNRLWQLGKPLEARADADRVQFLLRQLLQTRVTQFVTDDPRADLEAFGLQTPAGDLTLATGTNTLLHVQFGKSPTNDATQVFARRPQPPGVFLVPRSGMVDLLREPYSYYRDRTLLSLPNAPTIDRLDVRTDESFTLQRQTNGAWQITAPFSAPADAALVRQMFEDLQRLQILDFEADAVEDFAPFGLERAARQYAMKSTVTNAMGVTNQLVAQLDFSRPFSNRVDRAHARRGDEKSVYVVSYGEVVRLPRAAFQLRERRLWDFNLSNVTSVTVTQAGRTRRLAPDPATGWAPDEVLRAALEETLHRLGRLHAVNWVDRGEPAFRVRQAQEFQLAIDATIQGQPRTFTVRFGKLSPSGHVYAATPLEGGERIVFEFPRDLYQTIAQYLSIPAGDATGN